MKKTLTTQAIVLKNKRMKETDRLITLLTRERGKIATYAKGIRRINSKRCGMLEAGNFSKIYLIKTRGLPLLTQAELIHGCNDISSNLTKVRRLYQFLEILDRLFVEEEINISMFNMIIEIRQKLVDSRPLSKKQFKIIKKKIKLMIQLLGFLDADSQKGNNISHLVSEISEKPMKSYDFLKIID